MSLENKFRNALKENAKVEVNSDGVNLKRWFDNDAKKCAEILKNECIEFGIWLKDNKNSFLSTSELYEIFTKNRL